MRQLMVMCAESDRRWVRGRPAFTLIELIIVTGLIVLLVGSMTLALKDTGGGGLASAQTTLATMVGTARAQAAVHQTETILAIYATQPSATTNADYYLRLVQVFRNNTPGVVPEQWVPVGNPVILPTGVCVVPPSTAGLLVSGVTWPANPPRVSTLGGPVGLRQTVAGTAFSGATTAYVVNFTPQGTITQVGTSTHARIVVGATTIGANSRPAFYDANAVRGLLLRPTGAVTFVNQADGF